MTRALVLLLAANVAAFAQIESVLAPVVQIPTEKTVAATAVTEAPVVMAANLDPVPTAKEPRTLTGNDVLRDLSKQLTEHFSLSGELQLSLTRSWQPVRIATGEYQLRVTQWPANGVEASFFVAIKIESDGKTIAEGQLPLRAQLLQEVWTASERIERGQALDKATLSTRKVDVLRESQALIPADTDPANFEAVATIPAGRPLTRRDIAARPLIRKGQVVEVLAQSGLLAVTTKALALESGAAGDLIKMRNLESRKDFNAQVTHDNQVTVHF